MASDPKKRQKKLAKQAAKRKEKKHLAVRESSKGMAERFAENAQCPILHSRVSDSVWDDGIGYVLLSRELPGGRIAVAVFLLDRYCLGVKDAIAQIVGRSDYDERFDRGMRQRSNWEDEAPEFVRKLIEGGVAFAREYGFPPHADYQKAKMLLGDIDASLCTDDMDYGINGRPVYMRGPHESRQRYEQIVNILSQKLTPEEIAAMRAMDESAPDRIGAEMPLLEGDNFDDDEFDEDEESR